MTARQKVKAASATEFVREHMQGDPPFVKMLKGKRSTPKQRAKAALAIASVEWRAAERNYRTLTSEAHKAHKTVILKRRHLDAVIEDAQKAGVL